MALPLDHLPLELLQMVCKGLDLARDMNALVKTSHTVYELLNKELYRHAYTLGITDVIPWVIRYGPVSTLKKFIAAGVNITTTPDTKSEAATAIEYSTYSPLCEAAYHRRRDMVKFLITHGFDPLRLEPAGPAICWALRGRDLDIIRLVLTAMKTSLPAITYRLLISVRPLQSAVLAGRVSSILLLLQEGADINSAGLDYTSHVACAIHNDKPSIVKFLVNRGASIEDIVLPKGAVPIDHATQVGSVELVRMLLELAISRPTPTALNVAVNKQSVSIVKLLLEAGADPNQIDPHRIALICSAAKDGYHEIVAAFVNAGASQGLRDLALIYAVGNGHEEVVELFVRNGAQHLFDSNGRSALEEAVILGFAGIANCLLEAGFDIKADMRNLLVRTIMGDHPGVVMVLLGHGAFQECEGEEYTPLQLAVAHNHFEVAMTVLDYMGTIRETLADSSVGKSDEDDSNSEDRPFDVDYPDLFGRSPLFLATRYGSIELVQLMLNNGSAARNHVSASGFTPFSFLETWRHRKFNDLRDGVLQTIWDYVNHPELSGTMVDAVRHAEDVSERLGRCYWDCSRCCLPISWFEDYLVCKKCAGARLFVVCGDCVARNESCLDPSHKLVTRTPDCSDISLD